MLMQINATIGLQVQSRSMARIHSLSKKWLPILIAPSDSDLEVCVIDKGTVHALIFPCRKNGTQWVDASTRKQIDIEPTHWRLWAGDS